MNYFVYETKDSPATFTVDRGCDKTDPRWQTHYIWGPYDTHDRATLKVPSYRQLRANRDKND